MINYLILLLFMIPVATLGWRVVVSKSRNWAFRIGGAAAAMATLVGAVTIFDDVQTFSFKGWRNDVALGASATGSLYLLLWAQRHRTNQRHRTISLIAAIVGFIPFLTAIAIATLYGQI